MNVDKLINQYSDELRFLRESFKRCVENNSETLVIKRIAQIDIVSRVVSDLKKLKDEN